MMNRTHPNPNNQETIVESSLENKFSFLKLITNSNGLALVTALLLSTIILILAFYIMQSLSTETAISGSHETNTKSLYIAEGGLEKVRAEIEANQLSAFSYSGYSFGNSQEYIVDDSAYPMTTVTNPVNYVGEGADWYITKDTSTLALSNALTATNATWPIYKSISVGTDFAVVTMKRPRWFISTPTIIRVYLTSEADNVQNTDLLNKSVSGNLELEYSNNLLAFQTFRDPADDVGFLDNLANDSVVIGSNPSEDHYGTGFDNGIDSGDTFLSGIATFPKGNGRTLVIVECNAGSIGSFNPCDTDPYIIPAINSNTNTFIAGKVTIPSTVYYGKLYSSGACEDYSSTNESDFSVDDGQRYKLEYFLNTSLPNDCQNN